MAAGNHGTELAVALDVLANADDSPRATMAVGRYLHACGYKPVVDEAIDAAVGKWLAFILGKRQRLRE